MLWVGEENPECDTSSTTAVAPTQRCLFAKKAAGRCQRPFRVSKKPPTVKKQGNVIASDKSFPFEEGGPL